MVQTSLRRFLNRSFVNALQPEWTAEGQLNRPGQFQVVQEEQRGHKSTILTMTICITRKMGQYTQLS